MGLDVRQQAKITVDPGITLSPDEAAPKSKTRTVPLIGGAPSGDWQTALSKVRIDPAQAATAVEAPKSKNGLLHLPKKLWERIKGDRALKKMLTWRAVASLDTAVIALFITKNAAHSAAIGGLEIITKMVIKYGHERFWNKVDPDEKRLAARALSYRIIGGVDTFLLAWLVTGNPAAGLGLVGIEFFTKMILHAVHDGVWKKFAPLKEDDEVGDSKAAVPA